MSLVISSGKKIRGTNTNFLIDINWGDSPSHFHLRCATLSSPSAYGNIILLKINGNTLGFLSLKSCHVGHSVVYWYTGTFTLFKPRENITKITLVCPCDNNVIQDDDFPEIFFCFSHITYNNLI